jgi:hypothetical protein
MKTLAEIRALTAGARQPLEPSPSCETANRLRARCAELREQAAQRVAGAAQAGHYAVEVAVRNEAEYSYLERLYGQQGYRTAPAGGGYSSLIITLKWD